MWCWSKYVCVCVLLSLCRSPLAQMEEERREHVTKMKKMEMEMEQVFEMKVKEKVQKLKDSEAEVKHAHPHICTYTWLNEYCDTAELSHVCLSPLLPLVLTYESVSVHKKNPFCLLMWHKHKLQFTQTYHSTKRLTGLSFMFSTSHAV